MRESYETAESAEVRRSPQRSSDVFQRCSNGSRGVFGRHRPVLAFHAKELKQGLEAVSEAAGSTVARSRAAASGARRLRFRSHAKAVARSASGAATAFRP